MKKDIGIAIEWDGLGEACGGVSLGLAMFHPALLQAAPSFEFDLADTFGEESLDAWLLAGQGATGAPGYALPPEVGAGRGADGADGASLFGGVGGKG